MKVQETNAFLYNFSELTLQFLERCVKYILFVILIVFLRNKLFGLTTHTLVCYFYITFN